MKIIISGSSGLVGRALTRHFTDKGHEVTALVRDDLNKGREHLAALMEQGNVLINLAGAPISTAWSRAYKKEIYNSRILTTRLLVESLNATRVKPSLFITASAVGIYPDGKIVTEDTVEHSQGFLARVSEDWETEAMKAIGSTKVAIFRFGIILSNNGGAFPQLRSLFKKGLGGVVGSGRQGVSWIHIDDVLGAFDFVIDRELQGIFNITAPEVTDNRGFSKAIGQALHRPSLVKIPGIAVRVRFGEGATVLLQGQKAIPQRLMKTGYKFKFPDLASALADLAG